MQQDLQANSWRTTDLRCFPNGAICINLLFKRELLPHYPRLKTPIWRLRNLPDGVIVKLLGTGPVILNDDDGATAAVENTVPALTGGKAGDGNGDGTPDALQTNVASVAFLRADASSANPSTTAPVFVSLVADANDGKVDTADTNTATLTNVRQLPTPANLPAEIKMPLGLIAFSAKVGLNTGATPGNTGTPNTPAVGVSESFGLYVDSTLGVNGYWKQDASITDGGQFDADGKVDGVITDPGAAASLPLSLVSYAPELTAGGFWF